jgi:hypothetical protein
VPRNFASVLYCRSPSMAALFQKIRNENVASF